MKENKLTPEEIKKALECCKPDNDEGCLNCPLADIPVEECIDILHTETINLINHQQAAIDVYLEENDRLKTLYIQVSTDRDEMLKEAKAEIERLQEQNTELQEKKDYLAKTNDEIMTIHFELDRKVKGYCDNAIKEFAERLKEHLKGNGGLYCVTTMNAKIDNLVKEMVGEDK